MTGASEVRTIFLQLKSYMLVYNTYCIIITVTSMHTKIAVNEQKSKSVESSNLIDEICRNSLRFLFDVCLHKLPLSTHKPEQDLDEEC